MIHRQLSDKIVDFINLKQEHKNVLLVDGVRQVGKTTATEEALSRTKKKITKANLETDKSLREKIDAAFEFSDFERVLKSSLAFTPTPGQVLFIDEANESHRLGHFVRQMKEDWSYLTVILTGSMMKRLFRDDDVRIPVGRIQTLTVHPFSFREFLTANEQVKSRFTKYYLDDVVSDVKQIQKASPVDHENLLGLLDVYLLCGGIPSIVLPFLENPDESSLAESFLKYTGILREDFLKFFSEEYSNLFDRALASVSNILGQPYKKTLLIQNHPRLADNVLSVLEGWKLITKLEQRMSDPTAANSSHPKRYLFDVGLAKNKREMGLPTISVINTLNSALREPLGGLIEQLACNELLPKYPDLCGFRGPNYEIDFIVKSQDQAIPVECKASLKPNSNQYRSLEIYHSLYNVPNAAIISLAPYSKVKRGNLTIHHIPLYALSCFEELIG